MSVETQPYIRLILVVAVTACGGDGSTMAPDDEMCTIDINALIDGGVSRDGIPALTDPSFVEADDPQADYLLPQDRVIGFQFAGQTLAIPHNILWWHEVMNLNFPEGSVAVTYCPLTGTAMAFDRAPLAGAELGVSGLLFMNNLVMFDRTSTETLYPQMLGEGVCGPRTGVTLPRIAVSEMTWESWQEHYPQTTVVSGVTGWDRDYTRYPYGNYERLGEPPFLPVRFAALRPPKERLVGIEGAGGSFLAVPFLELDQLGELAVVNLEVDSTPFAVMWDRAAQSGIAFSPIPRDAQNNSPLSNDPVTLMVEGGRIFDVETGSEWDRSGRAVDGPLGGAILNIHPRSVIAFWFAWASFHPTTELWTVPS